MQLFGGFIQAYRGATSFTSPVTLSAKNKNCAEGYLEALCFDTFLESEGYSHHAWAVSPFSHQALKTFLDSTDADNYPLPTVQL